MEIRGHHLLCLIGFRGRGYGPAFIERMVEAQAALVSGGEARLTLVDKADAVCSACPYQTEEACRQSAGSEDRLRAKDRAVLELLGVAPGDRLSADTVMELLRNQAAGLDLGLLCSGCEWLSLGHCEEGLAALAGASERSSRSAGGGNHDPRD